MKHVKVIVSNDDTRYFEEMSFDTEEEPTKVILEKLIKECGEFQNNDVINIYIDEE